MRNLVVQRIKGAKKLTRKTLTETLLSQITNDNTNTRQKN